MALAALAAGGASSASAAPLFPQCPPVGNNQGCSQLIVVAPNGSVTVQTDPAAPQLGYDGSDDTLIGLLNNSKKPIPAINLASSTSIFGFENDGLCNPNNWPSAPPTTPPGCPGPQGFGQTGYEGPNTSYSNISSNTQTGTVTFTQPVPPSGASYWGLEEALSSGQLQSGKAGQPIATTPTVSGTTVSFLLTCVGQNSCIGKALITVLEKLRGNKLVRLATGARTHHKTLRTRRVIIGSAPFTATGGQQVPITVSLNRAGLALRNKIGSYTAGVSVSVAPTVGAAQVTPVGSVRFTGTKKHKHR
jgi:hypothetical protein